ncbi:hypothetical protein B9G54_00765 [Alloscardovia macacae]|nr:hypothetical protein [Alloscardovia macacae]OTA27637.1 hypothetical protein B9G54_00765 [Alloscardovia macacae]
MDTMTQFTRRDSSHLARMTDQFRRERALARADVDHVFEKWFGDLCPGWLEALDARDDPRWTEDQFDRFILAVDAHLPFRDALVLSALDTMSLEDMEEAVTHPFSERAAEITVTRTWEYLNNPYCVPDLDRTAFAVSIIRTASSAISESPSVGFYSMEAYLCWWMGRLTESEAANEKAIQLSEDYPLARIMRNTYTRGLVPAWLRRQIIEHAGQEGEEVR